jgi:sarcosine oxidase subunit gamma
MPEFDLLHRPALAGAKSGQFGKVPAAISLTALPEGHVVQALAAPGAGDLTGTLQALGNDGPHTIRPAGPGQWLIVGNGPLAPGGVRAMEARADSLAALVDQSHGRVRIAIGGTPIEAVLAKGTGIDLALAAFPVGQSAQTLIGHIAVHLTRVGADSFEIIVMRSFALDLWAALIDMGLEFGISAKAP